MSEQIQKAREIATRLYKIDPRVKPAFGWIGRQEKLGRDPALILRAMTRLEKKVLRGGPAGSAARYLGGTVRSMRDKETPRQPAQKPAGIGDVVSGIMGRMTR